MVRVMAVIDARRLSGPAKGLLDFCDSARGRLDPLVVVFQRGPLVALELPDACRRHGVRVAVVRERCRYDPAIISSALRIARCFRPDLVQTHGYKADIVGLAVRWRFGVPWVAFSHGPTNENQKMRLYYALDEVIIRRADRVIAVSEARKAALEARGCPPQLLVTIRNAVEMPCPTRVDIGDVRRELGLHADRPVVAVVGRLSPEKGQASFIEAMASVTRALPRVQGLIVGEGPEERRLRGKAATLGLHRVIHFLGHRRDMDRIYPAIDLLVLPSLSEGLPNVALEAMAHGRPVVGTRVGGVPEAIDDGVTGCLVAPQDAGALARSIVALLRDPVRCGAMGKAGRERIQHQFSAGPRAQRILSLYQDVLQQHVPTRRVPHGAQLADQPTEVR